MLEHYLRDGKWPDAKTSTGKVVLPGLRFLPAPFSAALKIEGRFVWDLPHEPFDLVGVIDWWMMGVGAAPPLVGDHKTTGDFRWVLSPGTLAGENVQSAIYLAYIQNKTGAPRVSGRWVYYRTRGKPAARAVDFEVDVEQIAGAFEKVCATGREMAAIKQQRQETALRVLDMRFEPSACDAYGGCVFRENCNLTSSERLVSLMSQERLKEKMQREKAERDAAAAAVAPAINPPEAALLPEVPGNGAGKTLREKLADRMEQPIVPLAVAVVEPRRRGRPPKGAPGALVAPAPAAPADEVIPPQVPVAVPAADAAIVADPAATIRPLLSRPAVLKPRPSPLFEAQLPSGTTVSVQLELPTHDRPGLVRIVVG